MNEFLGAGQTAASLEGSWYRSTESSLALVGPQSTLSILALAFLCSKEEGEVENSKTPFPL